MSEQNFKTSFIPTKPIQTVNKGGSLNAGVSSSGNFLKIIALIIFIVSLVVAGGVYIYKLSLAKKVEAQNTELLKVRDALNSPLISEADRLNSRINTIKTLLNNHLAPSELFVLLEQITLQTVQFTNFSLTKESNGNIKMTANGRAIDYESIVSQSDRLGNSGQFKDVLFSNLQPNTREGGVVFSLDSLVDNTLILYRNRIAKQQQDLTPTNDQNTVSPGESFEFPDNSSGANSPGGSNSN